MPAPKYETDAHGFPVPHRFDDEPPVVKPSLVVRKRRIRWLVGLLLAAALIFMATQSPLASQARLAMAQHHTRLAAQHMAAENSEAAIEELNKALTWRSDLQRLYIYRGRLRLDLGQFELAQSDLTQAVELDPTSAEAYLLRSTLYQRLALRGEADKEALALADLDLAVRHKPAKDANYMNARAYARAVFNVDLDQGLEDIQKAFEWEGNEDNTYFLDTRGYLYFRLGRHEEALADLNKAIDATEKEYGIRASLVERRGWGEQRVQRALEPLRENLAVMYHHRGEVRAALDQQPAADEDFRRAQEMGYNPAEGVF